MAEIQRAYDRLAESRVFPAGALQLLPLHSSLPPAEQQKVFQRPPPGVRKVVLSTNVAETSVTIDDIVYVIDTGRCRETTFDPATGLSRLDDTWVSAAAARQRRGRAGRVRPGVCFRLFSRRTLAAMAPQQLPEMHRVPLDQLCLQVLSMGLGPVGKFLGQALDPPHRHAIENAMSTLYSVGAIRGGVRGRWLDDGPAGKHHAAAAAAAGGGAGAAGASADGAGGGAAAGAGTGAWQLTVLGRHLSRMPLDVRLARMLLFAAVFGCVDPVLTIAATMSSRSPFLCPFDKRDAAERAKRRFARDRDWSDHLLFARAYDAWIDARGGGRRPEAAFCETNFLSATSLRTISDLRQQFSDVLADAGFAGGGRRGGGRHGGGGGGGGEGDPRNANSGNLHLIRAVICAGLYPNVIRVKLPAARFVEHAAGAVAADHTARELRMFTRPDGRVFLHPGSVNFDQGKFSSRWLVYHEKRATGKVYVRDSTMVTPYALLLFGGDVTVDHARGRVALDDDGWVRFSASGRVGALMRRLRGVLEAAVDLKLQRPGADLSDHPAVRALLRLLAFEL